MKLNSRHSNYQNFSEFKKNSNKDNINLDKLRFDWIQKVINTNKKISKMTDIGSNLGYMCVKFNEIFNAQCLGYEYEKPTYVKAREIINKNPAIKYLNKGLKLSTLKLLKKTDLIIHLNVLHHAGHMYDQNLIKNSNDWKKYSLKYLKILSKKSKFLFFQTGNVNYNKNYFSNEETFVLLPQILKSSGWSIKNIGMINFSKKELKYNLYNNSEIKKISKISCKRDKKSKKVLYYKDKKLIFKYDSGFLQRPLFWCQSKNFR